MQNTHYGETVIWPVGHIVERFLLQSPRTLLNTDVPSHFHQASRTTFSLNLILVSTPISALLTLEVCRDSHESDHWPIFLTIGHANPVSREPRHTSLSWATQPIYDCVLFENLTAVDDADNLLEDPLFDDLVARIIIHYRLNHDNDIFYSKEIQLYIWLEIY